MRDEVESIVSYQRKIKESVAPASYKGTHRLGRTGYRSEPPRRNAAGAVVSKRLRKAIKRLDARLRDHAATINRDVQNEKAYRKPGRLK